MKRFSAVCSVLSLLLIMSAPLYAQQDNADEAAEMSTPQEQSISQQAAQNQTVQEQPQQASAPVPPPKRDALDMYYRGRNADAEGRTEAAAAAYRESVEICSEELARNSKNIEAHIVMGWSLFRQGKYTEAVNISLAVLKLNVREARAMETIGECYFYLDKYDDSLVYFEKYLEIQPSGSKAGTSYFFMGEIYRLTGKTEHADIAYSAAVKREPRLPLWWYRLGLLRENAGKKTSAKSAYEQAVKIRPDYKEALDAIKRLS